MAIPQRPVMAASGGGREPRVRPPPAARLKRAASRARGRAARTLPARLLERFGTDNGATYAVNIAWNALQSIFPIALLMTTLLGVILARVGVTSTMVYQTVLAVLPDPSAQGPAMDALEKIRTKTGLFALLGVLGFLWSGSNLIGAMELAFDAVYGLRMRDFIRQKMVAIGVMVVFALLISLALGTAALLPLLPRLPGVPGFIAHGGPGEVIAQAVLGATMGSITYSILYYVVPNRRQRWAEIWPGAVAAGVGFEVMALAFPLYSHLAGPSMNQYGKTFGLLFLTMFFFYMLGVITVLGAMLNAILFETKARAVND